MRIGGAWITKLPDNGMAQCDLCATDFSISCGGRTDVRRHQESGRHAKLAASKGLYEGWGGPVAYGRVHTCTFTRRAYRSRTVRVGLPVYTLRPLRRVRPVHSDHIERCSQWTRTVRVGLALQCECSSGRVRYGSDAPSAHVCRLTYLFPLHWFLSCESHKEYFSWNWSSLWRRCLTRCRCHLSRTYFCERGPSPLHTTNAIYKK